jgi:hypothetical protein
MNTYLKAVCLAIYLLAVVATLGVLPPSVGSILQMIAVILLAAHALELLFAFKTVQRYQGPLIDSIALTLLFGLLHWKPLARGA